VESYGNCQDFSLDQPSSSSEEEELSIFIEAVGWQRKNYYWQKQNKKTCQLKATQIYLSSQVFPQKQDYCTNLRCGKTSISEKLYIVIERFSGISKVTLMTLLYIRVFLELKNAFIRSFRLEQWRTQIQSVWQYIVQSDIQLSHSTV